LSAQEFCEECKGSKKLVQRDVKLQSNAALPAAFERLTGDKIYQGLQEGFRVSMHLSLLAI
jgi:hypothetical protein